MHVMPHKPREFVREERRLTNFKAPVFGVSIRATCRFASSAVALLSRLVIIVSLAGYSLSTVNAAMHPQVPTESSQVETDHPISHGSDNSGMADIDQHHDQREYVDSKNSNKSCCQDYCGVTAINFNTSALAHPRLESVHEFVDDTNYVGLAPRLELPPNI